MENFGQQLREKFSGLGQQLEVERRIPSQQTQAFKRDRRAQNWFRRQISSLLSQDNNPGEGEFETVVAATAFAITSLEEAGLLDQKKAPKVPEGTTPTKMTNGKKDTAAGLPDSGRISRRFTSKDSKKDKQQSTGEVSTSKSEYENQRELENAATRPKKTQKVVEIVPTIRKTPTVTEKYQPDKSNLKSEKIKDVLSQPEALHPETPTAPTGGDAMHKRLPIKSNDSRTKADAWEEAEMAKIKKWYDKMNSTILSWESNKKAKAKSRKYRRESELEKKRERALKEYSSEMSTIEIIAKGAGGFTEKRKTKDESKVKEKAEKIRSTGKVNRTCLCF